MNCNPAKERIQNSPIHEQIFELQKKLQTCNDTMKIIEISNLIQEKKKQLPQEELILLASQDANSPKLSLLSQTCKTINQITSQIGQMFTQKSTSFSQEVAHKTLAEAPISIPDPTKLPNTEPKREIADNFSQIEIWLLNGNINEARLLLNKVIANDYRSMDESQKTQVKNFLQQIKGAEQPKPISPEPEPTKKNDGSRLVKLRIVLADGNIKKAREIAEEIMATDSGQYSADYVAELEKVFQNLHTQEVNASQNQNQQLIFRKEALEKENAKLSAEITTLQATKQAMQQEIQKFRPAYEELVRVQKITACVMADIHLRNKALLLSEKTITFFVHEYLASSPRGGNINSLASIREAGIGPKGPKME
jgi:hypothetical protein